MAEEFDCDDSYVCAECFDDDGLTSFIQACAESEFCSYCGRKATGNIAAPFLDVLDRITEGIGELYGQADDEGVPYDGREGGYQLPVFGSYEILDEVGLYIENDQLRRCVEDNLPDIIWSERDPFSLKYEDSLRYGWEEFCDVVKHDVRYLMFPPPEEDPNHDEIVPAHMLDALGHVLNNIEPYAVLGDDRTIFRARVHDVSELAFNVEELGPAPRTVQIYANRMSAAGIGLFYGAFDVDTALAETVVMGRDKGRVVTVAALTTVQPTIVLDLTELPAVPSVFDDQHMRDMRSGLIFLHEFRDAIAAPIKRDGREHIEYVPSQIVTEFLRFRHQAPGGRKLGGVLYPSTRLEGGVCCTLFVTADDLVAPPYVRPVPRVDLKLVTAQCFTRGVSEGSA